MVLDIPCTFSTYSLLPVTLYPLLSLTFTDTEREGQRGHYSARCHTATQHKNPDSIPMKVAELEPRSHFTPANPEVIG